MRISDIFKSCETARLIFLMKVIVMSLYRLHVPFKYITEMKANLNFDSYCYLWCLKKVYRWAMR